MTAEKPSKQRAALVFGVLNLLSGATFSYLFFVVTPSRHGWFTALAVIVCSASLVGGVGMLTRKPWGFLVGKVAACVLLLFGLALIWGLLASAAYLHGIYGGFGQGAAIVLVAIVALVFELVCLLPTFQLWWLRRVAQQRQCGD